MSIVGYIVLGIIVLLFLLVYAMFVIAYIGGRKQYREADRVEATVCEDLGDLKYCTGSVAVGVPRYRTFHKYKVAFRVDGREYVEEVELRNRIHKIGDVVEVRCERDKDGRQKVLSEAFLCWNKEMAIGFTGGIILGVVLCILKFEGRIR